MSKNFLFVLLLVVVVGAILYLQEPVSVVSSGDSPELEGISGYINTNNISIKENIGRNVVLVDFWTYSCINCQRTLPYLTAWHEKYKDSGLVIIGVHAPEFNFEKEFDNVKRAVDKWGIRYPVVLDNNHDTWRAFRNRYWPAKYLIDIKGNVVWSHFGEGAYDEAERMIQKLLSERMSFLDMEESLPSGILSIDAPKPDFFRIGTPEIYLGYQFTRGNFGNKEGLIANSEVSYFLPDVFEKNNVYLEGDWFVSGDHVTLLSDSGKVVLRYDAKDVNIVASSPSSNVSVFVDGVEVRELSVDMDELYQLVAGDSYGEKLLKFEIQGSGFELYSFTFG